MLASFPILSISSFGLHCLIEQLLEAIAVYEVQIMTDLWSKTLTEQLLLLFVRGHFFRSIAGKAVKATLIVTNKAKIGRASCRERVLRLV